MNTFGGASASVSILSPFGANRSPASADPVSDRSTIISTGEMSTKRKQAGLVSSRDGWNWPLPSYLLTTTISLSLKWRAAPASTCDEFNRLTSLTLTRPATSETRLICRKPADGSDRSSRASRRNWTGHGLAAQRLVRRRRDRREGRDFMTQPLRCLDQGVRKRSSRIGEMLPDAGIFPVDR